MENQEYYYKVSYQRTKEGPMGVLRRPDMERVAEWLKENAGSVHFAMILQVKGSSHALLDREE